MKKFLTLLLLLITVQATFANVVKVDRRYGYYVDGTGQIPEYQRIAPPNEGKIPTVPHPTKTVVPFNTYYDVNHQGIRRPYYMEPIIPNHNIHYSNRRATPYSRDEYLDVWCTGKINYDKGVCELPDVNVYFFKARDWSWGVSSAAWKNIGKGKPRAVWLMVDDIALDAKHLSDMKRWSTVYGTKVFFSTIDAYIPADWVID